jgi:L-fuculose-phosphate aldolase
MSNPIAPALPDLTPRQELALLARMLFREGYDDHLAGHITYKQADDTLLVNPFGLTWDEITASDVMQIDKGGKVLDGKWTVTPAIPLHLELHASRHDAGVVVHNHPEWSTVWADVRRAPGIYDQTGAMFHGEVAVYDDYQGAVNDRRNAAEAVKALGDANVALLAGHGVMVIGNTPAQTYLRASSFEWRCKRAYQVATVGGGTPLDAGVAERFGVVFDTVDFPGLFQAMARRELRADPSILD